jgi:hypothetical protein
MPPQIRFQLRLVWYVLIGCVTIAPVLPGGILHDSQIANNLNHTWVHFLVYMALAALPLLGWWLRAGVVLTSATAVLSVVLQAEHGFVSGRGMDVHSTTINLLGVAAGVLLSLNILALCARGRNRPTSLADRWKSRQK